MRRLAILLLAVLSGCQSARYVSKGPDEGIVALPADTPQHRSRAEQLMAAHFPDGYEIVFEEEVKVGSVTHHHANTHYREHVEPDKRAVSASDEMHHTAVIGSDHGPARSPAPPVLLNPLVYTTASADTLGITTTQNKTEWRIRYRRKSPEPTSASDALRGTSISSFPGPASPAARPDSEVHPAKAEHEAGKADERAGRPGIP